MDAVADGKVEELQGIPVTDDGNDEAQVAEGINAIAAEGGEEEEGVMWLKDNSSIESLLIVGDRDGDGDFSFSDRQFVSRTLMAVASLSTEDANVASTVVTGGGGWEKAPLEEEVPVIAVDGEEAATAGKGDTVAAKVAGKEVVLVGEGETVDVVVDGEVEALHGIPVTNTGTTRRPVAEVVNAIAIDGEEVAPAGEGNTVTAKVAVKEVVPAAEGETMDAVANGEVEALQGIPVTDDGNKETTVAEGVNVIAVYGEEAAPEGEGDTVTAKVAGKEVTLAAEGQTVDAVVDGEVEPLPLPSTDRQFVLTHAHGGRLALSGGCKCGVDGVDRRPGRGEGAAGGGGGGGASRGGDTLAAKSILTVGDGDFSFSLALATAFGSGENLVATSPGHLWLTLSSFSC
ncbi:hypothetical protein GUJ93_ZPchr0009g152 [Zizania palustris]|uniref:25S rRNA (uridine-N(3))-methyltransferase BMT5-like domain-containing protein n=1 Tax=Zizania palustris TaxID=103762 RepID=A0A8J5V747_ZIZPA|nr:hypothetical protein GUJ93_ZPchr0009g152 [Zizania palustris]